VQIAGDIRHDLPAGIVGGRHAASNGMTDRQRSHRIHRERLPATSDGTPGKAWKSPGLRGIMTIRGLVESDRWEPAWKTCGSSKRREVNLRCAA
jgi:hypothetical protein